LAQVLRRLPTPSAPELLVGTATGDDAAVWRVSADRAFVSTVDFFTPVVDDARTWGMIAAANSASDVYAMGGRPLFALNVAGWPRDLLSLDLLADALGGAAEIAAMGGWVVAGGHTVDAPEPFLGQAVTGEVHPDRMMTNDAARPGDVLVLTKPIGTGLITTALKRSPTSSRLAGGALADAYTAAVASMTTLNAAAAVVATAHGIRCATDITGFGLLGHLHKLALASGVSLTLEATSLPLLPGVESLRDAGFIPGGTGRNLDFVQSFVAWEANRERWEAILADPQTSGGLVLCVGADRVDHVVRECSAQAIVAVPIGTVGKGTAGTVNVR
jgi:selenide, water dikinase